MKVISFTCFFTISVLQLCLGQLPSQMVVEASVSKVSGWVAEEKKAIIAEEKAYAPSGVDINYLPLFGHYKKTQEQLIEDELFLKETDRNFPCREEASDFFTKMGWSYLEEGNKGLSTHRFNLAHLLNPKNIEVYWGLGVISYQSRNISESISLMNEGLNFCNFNNAILMVDLATIYIQYAFQHSDNNSDEIKKAVELLHKSIELKPDYPLSYVQLALARIVEKKYEFGWEAIHALHRINPLEVKPEIIQALKSNMADPMGIF